MPRKKGVERRQDPRYQVNVNVDSQSLDMFQANYVSNISKGGVFIETPEPLPVQSEINMTLRLPGISHTITVKGKVAWTYDRDKISGEMRTGMGIRFINLSAEERNVLMDYLSKISQDQEPLS
ncbi:MAG TPA: TIGR02266 family protein [Nitrospiria bacterium]